jgi:hypothetical protein
MKAVLCMNKRRRKESSWLNSIEFLLSWCWLVDKVDISGKVIKSPLFSLYGKPSTKYVVLYVYIEHNEDTFEKEILMIVWRCTKMFETQEDPVYLECDGLSLCPEIITLKSNTFPLNVGIWLPIDTASYLRRRLSTATPQQQKKFIFMQKFGLYVILWMTNFGGEIFIWFQLSGKSRFNFP